MAQDYIKMNGITIKQPLKDLEYNFETTYTEDTTRVQSGVLHSTPMFTVEQLGYEASNLTVAEVSQILQIIAKGQRFLLHYFSPYYGAWRDDYFYVGQGSIEIGTLQEDSEKYTSLSFNMTGVNPI